METLSLRFEIGFCTCALSMNFELRLWIWSVGFELWVLRLRFGLAMKIQFLQTNFLPTWNTFCVPSERKSSFGVTHKTHRNAACCFKENLHLLVFARAFMNLVPRKRELNYKYCNMHRIQLTFMQYVLWTHIASARAHEWFSSRNFLTLIINSYY